MTDVSVSNWYGEICDVKHNKEKTVRYFEFTVKNLVGETQKIFLGVDLIETGEEMKLVSITESEFLSLPLHNWDEYLKELAYYLGASFGLTIKCEEGGSIECIKVIKAQDLANDGYKINEYGRIERAGESFKTLKIEDLIRERANR